MKGRGLWARESYQEFMYWLPNFSEGQSTKSLFSLHLLLQLSLIRTFFFSCNLDLLRAMQFTNPSSFEHFWKSAPLAEV